MSSVKPSEFALGSNPREIPRVAWFCLRSHPKHEQLAARHLAQMEEVEVFSPRIRFKRSTRNGPLTVTESMFPNYLFARLDWKQSLARVHYAPGVSSVVHFGSKWPTIPEVVIAELRLQLGVNEICVVSQELQPGDNVTISGGPFHGLRTVVSQVLSGQKRVMILMDFLGRQTAVEVNVATIVRHGSGR